MNETQEKPFMSVWVVYFNPRDFPGRFVARRHDILHDKPDPVASSEHFVRNTLREVRETIPLGLICMNRSPGDDAKIVETWI